MDNKIKKKKKKSKDKSTVGFFGGKFLPLHYGHVYAIIEASNQVDKLYVVLTSSVKRDAELCERDGCKAMPATVRMSWLGEMFRNFSNIELIDVADHYGKDNYDWNRGSSLIKSAIPEKITHVFSSEHSYGKHFKKYYPKAKYIVIDADRNAVPVRATEIRCNPYNHWKTLPECVKAFFVKKVAIVGTESCGKSALAKQLAEFYDTNYVHEVGRDYCDKYKNQLTVPMFDSIAMDHFRLQEESVRKSNKILFVDSDAVITQYYLDMYFSKYSKLIDEIISLQNFDLILYLEPDVEWVEDGVRFAGGEKTRKENNIKLKAMFKGYGFHFVTVSGKFSERFDKAKLLVDGIFKDL